MKNHSGVLNLMSILPNVADYAKERNPLKPMALARLPDRPLVSILMSSYNHERYLSDAIKSVLCQTYSHLELIICDDGSTDSSSQALERYRRLDARIKVLLRPHGGQSLALNAAFCESIGNIICLLDGDDVFMPEKVERVVYALATNPDSGLAVNAMLLVNATREPLGEIPFLHQLPSGWHGSSLSLTAPHFLPAIPPCSGLSLHRSVAEVLFPLPSDLTASSDGVIQVLAPMITPIVAIRTPVSEYRIHGRNVSAVSTFTEDRLRNLDAWQREIWRAWRRYLVLYQQRAVFDFQLPSEMAQTPMTYAYARFRSDPHSKNIYRAIPTGYFQTLPRWYQWFWRCSIWMPNWLFRRTFAFVYGQTPARLLVGRILKACRNALLHSEE
jgi:glycosyltransferase involved in cell wall biosynthesis